MSAQVVLVRAFQVQNVCLFPIEFPYGTSVTLHFLSLNQYKVHSEIDSNNFVIVLQKKVLLESLKYIMSHETGLQKFKGFQNIK